MGRPYSEDLRERVLSAVKKGMGKSEACRLFGISRNTLHKWQKRLASEGHCHPLSLKGRPSARRKIKDLAAFREFVLANPNKTQTELAELWGDGANQQLVSRMLKQLAITR